MKMHEFQCDLYLHTVAFVPDDRRLAVVTEMQMLIVRLPK